MGYTKMEGDLDDGTEGSNVGYRVPGAEKESDLETGEPGEEQHDQEAGDKLADHERKRQESQERTHRYKYRTRPR